jgi:hemerythrin
LADFIVWKSEYNFGIFEIDMQHLKLAGLINKLHESRGESQEEKVVSKILDELILYTQYHFEAEEASMEKYGYPGLAEHKMEHAALTAKVIEKKQEFIKIGIDMTMELLLFLKDWFLNHTQGSDRKYIPYILKH